MDTSEPSSLLRSTRIATWGSAAVLGVLARTRAPIARALVYTSIATIGIAHGATDDAVLVRAGIVPPERRRIVSILYGLAALGTFATARMRPRDASRALFALSWFHFGSADASFARACGSAGDVRFETIVRGMIPLAIAGHDARSRIAAVLATARALRHVYEGRPADALDVAIPTALMLAIPPKLGFAIYFGAWHAVRHSALLLERDPRPGSIPTRVKRFAREAAPNVAIALGVAALAFVWERSRTKTESNEPTALALAADAEAEAIAGALILAITVPHEIAVGLIERRARAR